MGVHLGSFAIQKAGWAVNVSRPTRPTRHPLTFIRVASVPVCLRIFYPDAFKCFEAGDPVFSCYRGSEAAWAGQGAGRRIEFDHRRQVRARCVDELWLEFARE